MISRRPYHRRFSNKETAMAISSENRKTGIFTGDGKTTRYPFDFRVREGLNTESPQSLHPLRAFAMRAMLNQAAVYDGYVVK